MLPRITSIKFLTQSSRPGVRDISIILALEINEIWKLLCKQFTIPPEKSSFIPTPKPFIVPGGRFREFYYWDTFWVVEGLLISDMVESALNMHTNFRSFIENYGYVPNGARIYY